MSRFLGSAARTLLLLWIALPIVPPASRADEPARSVSVLHTNDLHSHFRPSKGPLGLGGVARLKTFVDRYRAAHPGTLLVDGGDFSEGDIYYTLGAGLETVRMMEHLGYDATVLGNHDWLNGPDVLLDVLKQARPGMAIVSANVDAQSYRRADEFRSAIPSFVIREAGGVRVAFIGVSTYELIYDRWLKPVRVLSPFSIVDELSRKLRSSGRADVVLAISHNGTKTNQELLKQAPALDGVIGAHDHRKYVKPVRVPREGATEGWIVETGCWGHFIGEVELAVAKVRNEDGSLGTRVSLKRYQLHQLDQRIEEDAPTLARIEELESRIEARRGPVFHDHVAESRIAVDREGQENLLGNLATDAYLAYGGADFAVDQVNFIYGELHRGDITTADVYNSNPAIYDPKSEKSWTLKHLSIEGKTLRWLLNLLFASKQVASRGIVSGSNLEVVFDPAFNAAGQGAGGSGEDANSEWEQWRVGQRLWKTAGANPFAFLLDGGEPDSDTDPYETEPSGIQQIRIGGKDLDPARTYTMAAGGGVIEALRFLNSVFPGAIPLNRLVDTGVEDWQLMRRHLANLRVLDLEDIPYGNRVRTSQPDLGVLAQETRLQWQSGRGADGRARARVSVVVHNYGKAASAEGASVILERITTDDDLTVDPAFAPLANKTRLPAIAPGDSREIAWDALVTAPTRGQFAPLRIRLDGNRGEVNASNDEAWLWERFVR